VFFTEEARGARKEEGGMERKSVWRKKEGGEQEKSKNSVF
jgi:hypothetical protein